MDTQHQQQAELSLPAGLVDENVEVFVHNGELKATYAGRVFHFMDLPWHIINKFYNALIEHEDAWKEFRRQGIMDQMEMMKIFVRCNFGGWDRVPDLADGKLNREFWACPQRGDCPYGEKICMKLKAKNGYLSKREIDVMRLIAKGLLAKEIADRLGIAEGTVKKHTVNIHRKLRVNNNVDVTNFAFRNNLIH